MSEVKTVIPKKDKILVLVAWGALVLGIRTLFVQWEWFGSVGAIAVSLAIVLIFFRTPIGKRAKPRFYAVMQFWYSRKFQWMVVAYLVANAGILYLLDYGHDHFDDDIGAGRFPQEIGNDPVRLASYVLAESDIAYSGAVTWFFWLGLYENSEFVIFFTLVKLGVIFKQT